MEAKAKAKPAAKKKPVRKQTGDTRSRKELTQDKSKLDRDIKARKAELDVLNAKIGDMENLSSKRDSLQAEVDDLTQTKRELGKLTVQQQTVSKEVEALVDEKKKLDSYIKKNTPKKATLESELQKMEASKSDLENKVGELVKNGEAAHKKVEELKEEKAQYDASIHELKTEYALYPRDLKEMSRDAVSQIRKYSSLATMTGVGALVMMLLVLLFLILPVIDTTFSNSFRNHPQLSFFSILTTKILLVAVLVSFAAMLLGLTKSFVAQYIASRNRLTSLRVSDYLIDRVQSGKSFSTDILSNILPEIMNIGASAFDTKNRTKSK